MRPPSLASAHGRCDGTTCNFLETSSVAVARTATMARQRSGTRHCIDPQLNGVDVAHGSGEADAICAAITTIGIGIAASTATAGNPHYKWTGSTWMPDSTPSTPKLTRVDCI